MHRPYTLKVFRFMVVLILLSLNFVSFASLKAENKPLIKVILLDEEVGKIPNYIAEKEKEGYIVEEEKVSRVGNTPVQMKNYIKSQKFKKPNLKYVIIPVNYLSYMRRYLSTCINCGKVHIRGLSDGYYCNTDDDSDEIPEVFLSRANAEMLNQRRKKFSENNVTIACPITTFKSFAYQDKWKTDYYNERNDYSLLCQNIQNLVYDLSIKSTTLFETDGISPCEGKSDLSLNTENFLKCFPKTSYLICKASYEIIQYFEDQNYPVIGSQETYQRAIWIRDKNNNKLAEASEKKTEGIVDFDRLPSLINEADWYYDRIGFTDLKEFEYMTNYDSFNKLFSGYISFLPSKIYEDTISYYIENYKDLCSDVIEDLKWILDHHDETNYHSVSYYDDEWFKSPNQYLLNGYSISESIWLNYWFGTVYGDPTKSLSNIVLNPKMVLTP